MIKFRFGSKTSPLSDGGGSDMDSDEILITGQNGFVAGTRVAGSPGWQAVEKLDEGDLVLTFDHGMQPIVDIQRETLVMPNSTLPGAQHPVLVPSGTINNQREIWLMPEQGLLVESDVAVDAMGDPFSVVPSRALLGFRGVRTAVPGETLEVTTLAFEQDEVIYAESGLLMYCPRPRQILSGTKAAEETLYNVLDLHDGRYLVRCLNETGGFAGFVYSANDELPLKQRVPEGHPLHA